MTANNLDHYITKWLHPSNSDFFTVATSSTNEEVEWLFDPNEPVPEYQEAPHPSFPRVVPPEVQRRNHPSVRKSMEHDGGPGLRDGKHASRIKYLLREWL